MKGKLFLSGGGDENQTFKVDELFLKYVNHLLYIPVAWNDETNDFEACKNWISHTISRHNKKVQISYLTDLTKEIDLENYDAIYLGGGNTFKLLKKLKENKFDKKLLIYYNKGGIIYGASAGAIVLGKDITPVSIGSNPDINKVKLKDTRGLNLIQGCYLQCHFEDNQIKEHQEFIANLNSSSNSNIKIICIPEESALLAEKENFKVIGLNPITIITTHNIKKYKVNEQIKF